MLIALPLIGCATVRVTDPPRTADEQFLEGVAIRQAVGDLSFVALRDQKIYVDSKYLYDGNFPSAAQSFLLGELRNRLLIEGASLAETRDDCEIVLEVRSEVIGVNRQDFLLGISGTNTPVGSADVGSTNVPIILPELAIIKSRKQFGYASVSITAYFKNTGEIVASSGPFVGKTKRTDYWFLGIGPSTTGNIPPAQE